MPHVAEIFVRSITAGAAYEIEQRLRRHDGMYRWFENRGVPIRDASGRVVRWYVLLTDIEDKRRAEEELRARELVSRDIVDNIPIHISLLSPTGKVEMINRQILDYTGRTIEELEMSNLVHPDDLERAVEASTNGLRAGVAFDIVYRMRRHDGVYRWFEARHRPLTDPQGRVVRWCVSADDIDDRKGVEDALWESELYARQIVDTIPGMVALFTPAGEVEYVNQQILDFYGDTQEDRKRWTSDGKVHEEDVGRAIEIFSRCITTGEPFEMEVRSRRFDGVYRWIQSRGLALRDREGNVVRWYNLLVDIDDRKRAEEALRESERDLQLTIDTIPALAWSAKPDGSADFFNRHYLDFVGLSAEQLEGVGWSVAVHADDLSGLLGAWQEMMTLGQGGVTEARMRRFDGEYRWFLFRTNPLRDEAGHIVKWYGVNTDIQDRKIAEESLSTARSDLAHVSRVSALNALTASIAHEINQPLAGIITNANTCLRLLDAKPPSIEGARKTAQRTIRDGNRAAEIVVRLRNLFSKNTAKSDAIGLNDAAREVVALLSSDLQRNRVTLRTELAPDLPLLKADRVQLQQVILNLLLNACDAMSGVRDRQRLAVLRTVRDGDDVQLSVRDAGVGFVPADAERLFEAFHTTKANGMGIGLSVSRSIIENHHGRIWCETNEGPGATFSFRSRAAVPDRALLIAIVDADESVDAHG